MGGEVGEIKHKVVGKVRKIKGVEVGELVINKKSGSNIYEGTGRIIRDDKVGERRGWGK